MARESVTFLKSKSFAIRIVKLYQYLCEEKKEYVLSKQLLRCGTSVGANLAEAVHGISDKDFLAKLYISRKECSEAQYWIELLHKTGYLTEAEFNSVNNDCIVLLKMLTASTKTLSVKLQSRH